MHNSPNGESHHERPKIFKLTKILQQTSTNVEVEHQVMNEPYLHKTMHHCLYVNITMEQDPTRL
jgi:hypothetical protein